MKPDPLTNLLSAAEGALEAIKLASPPFWNRTAAEALSEAIAAFASPKPAEDREAPKTPPRAATDATKAYPCLVCGDTGWSRTRRWPIGAAHYYERCPEGC